MIPAAKVLEEGGHDQVLVVWALKVVREATSGEIRCDLRLEACRSADDGDKGTCKSVAM